MMSREENLKNMFLMFVFACWLGLTVSLLSNIFLKSIIGVSEQ